MTLNDFDICPGQLDAGCSIIAQAIRRAMQDPAKLESFEQFRKEQLQAAPGHKPG